MVPLPYLSSLYPLTFPFLREVVSIFCRCKFLQPLLFPGLQPVSIQKSGGGIGRGDRSFNV